MRRRSSGVPTGSCTVPYRNDVAKVAPLEESTHFKNAEDATFDWQLKGRCRGRTGLIASAWRVQHGGESKIGTITITNDRLIEFALSVCATCPVQWDCTAFALITSAPACTYGCDIADLRWLAQREKDAPGYAFDLIDAARELALPVQVLVAQRRRHTQRKRSHKPKS